MGYAGIGTTRARSALGRALRAARYDRGISQRALEDRSGVDQTTISRIENGRSLHLRYATYVALLDALGASEVSITVRRRPPPPSSGGTEEDPVSE